LPTRQVDGRVEVTVNDQTKVPTRVGPHREIEVAFDFAAALTRFGTREESVHYSDFDAVPFGFVEELA
jgi:hypothetical protein